MPLIVDRDVFQTRLGALPLVTYQAGENVLTAGSRTGQLLILKKGAGAVIKETIEIARVAEPGAVFGEISALLDQPHAADVRALGPRNFTLPMRLLSLCKTRLCFCTLRRSWHAVSTPLTTPLLN